MSITDHHVRGGSPPASNLPTRDRAETAKGSPALAFVANKHNLNSIAALTGALEADARTKALPLFFCWQDDDLLARLDQLAGHADPLVVALSFATADVPAIAALLAGVRRLEPAPFVVAGGPHPSARATEVLSLGTDAVVVGEGEVALPALLARVLSGAPPAGLPGVAILENGNLVQARAPPT